MQNEVRFRIGEIEFEAKGDPDVIERERNEFVTKLLPLAVDAVARTRNIQQATFEEKEELQALPESSLHELEKPSEPNVDLSRLSLAEYIKQKGADSHIDFTLCAAYYVEKARDAIDFSSEDVKEYYAEGRKTAPKNISDTLNKLAGKGLIKDSPSNPNVNPKRYQITISGITYVEALHPKDNKEKKISTKSRKTRAKVASAYTGIDVNGLNLSNYPEIKSLEDFKEKMLMVLYIITTEKKGEWFQTSDVAFLMSDIFGEAVTEPQIKGVFNREKLWFKVESLEGNKKEKRRKLLNKGIEFAQSLLPQEGKGT